MIIPACNAELDEPGRAKENSSSQHPKDNFPDDMFTYLQTFFFFIILFFNK